jgi:hypothetical protein
MRTARAYGTIGSYITLRPLDLTVPSTDVARTAWALGAVGLDVALVAFGPAITSAGVMRAARAECAPCWNDE